MVYVLALAASLANALTSVLQRMGVEGAPADSVLKWRLLSYAMRRGVWLLGFAFMIVSFVMQATALHFGRLTEVQPILTTELLFLVVILATWFRYRVGWKEWAGASAGAAGLAGFLIFASPGGGNILPGTSDWIEVGLACGAVMVLCIVLASRGPRWWRALMFGTAAAVGYAFTAALTKVVTGYLADDWVSIFRHWETYGLAVVGVLSVFLAQNAFHAGPIAASQSALVLVDPLASILIGIGLFGDQLRTAAPWGALEAFSLLVLFLGMLTLCHSPLINGVKGEQSEYLSPRWRSKRVAAAVGMEGATPPPLSS
jgi:drug/metabolite transporter (DMT)-like permease